MGPTKNYSIVIASSGQASTHTPQSTQASTSISALPSTIFIASLGHSSTQDSQPLHFSLSTLAGIYITLSKNDSKLTSRRRDVTKLWWYYNINFLQTKPWHTDTSGLRIVGFRGWNLELELSGIFKNWVWLGLFSPAGVESEGGFIFIILC